MEDQPGKCKSHFWIAASSEKNICHKLKLNICLVQNQLISFLSVYDIPCDLELAMKTVLQKLYYLYDLLDNCCKVKEVTCASFPTKIYWKIYVAPFNKEMNFVLNYRIFVLFVLQSICGNAPFPVTILPNPQLFQYLFFGVANLLYALGVTFTVGMIFSSNIKMQSCVRYKFLYLKLPKLM